VSVRAPGGIARTTWLLVRLRLLRLLNMLSVLAGSRFGTRGRRPFRHRSAANVLISGLLLLIMVGGFAVLAREMVANMQDALGTVTVAPGDGEVFARPIAAEPGHVLAPGVLDAATFAASLLLLSALLATVANWELTRPDWDLEWLATLPLPRPTLLAGKIVERVLSNHFGVMTLGPFLTVLAWTCGFRWTAPLLGAGLTLALLLPAAAGQLLIDTGLRLSLPPPRLRDIHAVISIVALPPMFLPLAMGFPGSSLVFTWASPLPDWMAWQPAGLAVRVLSADDAAVAVMLAAIMVLEALLLALAGGLLVYRQMRNGVVAAGTREAIARQAPRRAAKAGAKRSLLSPVLRRELRLLGRDRTFMIQILVVPATMIALQVALNPSLGSLAGLLGNPPLLAAFAFLLAAYTLMFSAFQTLNTEGQGLWILYCVPHSLESVLRQKARLWAVVASVFPMLAFASLVAAQDGITLQLVGPAVVAFAGVPIFAVTATALGVFGCDPLTEDRRQRLQLRYLYLFMGLCTLYVYAIFVDSVSDRVALVLLTALVAAALWQKARDRLPFLLDPSASPPAQVSAADGLIAALLFFVVQGLAGAAQAGVTGGFSPGAVWISFLVAGAVTFAVMRLVYRLSRTTGVPRMLGAGVPKALLLGLVGGAAAALAGLIYIEIALLTELAPVRRPGAFGADALPLGVALVAVAAAPVFEEFIFRGLIFGGLRRSTGVVPAAVASASVFAIIHPPVSWIPVLVMGLCAAAVYERTRMLAAPILVHAVYNGMAIALPAGGP
jgi:membrane protease YdiL (CAAX protease family)